MAATVTTRAASFPAERLTRRPARSAAGPRRVQGRGGRHDRPAGWSSELDCVVHRAAGDRPAALVDEVVVSGAEEDAVVLVRPTAGGPVLDVVGPEAAPAAATVPTADVAVALADPEPHLLRHDPLPPAVAGDGAVLVLDQ